jgi:phage terminase large subunit GpA-like protein
MDAISDPLIPHVCVKSSAQVGKTLLVKAIIGYFVDQDPSPILVVQPNIEMAETFSKDRLAPMIRDTPCLRGKIADAKSRDSGNTILHKRFPGGHITMVGANAPAGLAMRPVRVVLFDEVDRYPPSAGTEGDSITLGKARTKTFWNRKILEVSTPGDLETSRIEKSWQLSDQREYHVPCQYCTAAHPLRWANVKFADANPETAVYVCEECDNEWSNAERLEAIRHGRWVAKFPERRNAGFHLNELCSPFRSLAEIVSDFLEAKGSRETLKVWVNTSLGECWEDREGEKVDANVLNQRREPYKEPPAGAVYVTLTWDVQDDRLEGEFVAWGEGEESWGLDYVVLEGDPGKPELWNRADDQLARTFRREDGAILTVSAAAIDSGGHYTSKVYEYALKHRGRVFAMKGRGGLGVPLVEVSKSILKKHGIRLHHVGTDTAKELLLLSRIRVVGGGAGCCHWPAHYPSDYFEQLTAEKRKVKYHMGRPVHHWVLPKGKRNEALDLRVYGLALISMMRPNFSALAERTKPISQPPPTPTPTPVERRPSSYLQGRR